MKTLLKNNEINTKNNEINTKNTTFTNKSLIRNSFNLSIDKWFKGSRSRGIR